MTQQVITTTGAGTWSVPANLPAGSSVTVETWGAGSGANGQTSTSFGAAGAGGAYASSNYVITPNDISYGVPYVIGAGSAGGAGANPAAGGNTSWSVNTNAIQISNNLGASQGTPGTLPTWSGGLSGSTPSWSTLGGTGLTTSIVGLGTTGGGFPYIIVNLSGVCSSGYYQLLMGQCAATASQPWTYSSYLQVLGGSLANVSAMYLAYDTYSGSFASPTAITYAKLQASVTPTSTFTQYSGTATSDVGTTIIYPYLYLTVSSTLAINLQLLIAGVQLEQSSTATYFKSTPGYTLAAGGGAQSGNTGGTGGAASSSTGSISAYSGGNGANYNAAGSGAGASAGPAGAGAAGTTAGQGGQADNGSGGVGGAVSATSPGNAGTANVEGGGAGGGLKTVSGTGGAGAVPGGGGGGTAVAAGTGGAGAGGQLRLTYFPIVMASVASVGNLFVLP